MIQEKNGSGLHTEVHDPPEKQDGRGTDEHQPENEESEKPKPPLRQRVSRFRRSHPTGIIIGALALIAILIAGFFLLRYWNSYESTDDAQVDGHLDPISARIAGTVTGVYIEDNQFVAAGQLLVELDPHDYRNAEDQAKAAYMQSQAQLKAADPNVPIVETTNQTTISTTQADLMAARAGVVAATQNYAAKIAAVEQAKANNQKAQTDLMRYRLLVDKDEISRQQYDSAVAAAKTQAASVDAAAADADAAQKVIDQRRAEQLQAESRLAEATRNAPRSTAIRQADVAASKANTEAARAQLNQAQLNLSYTKIVAPWAGIVTAKAVEIGQQVQPGQMMLTISQTDDIWITANFKETQLQRMRPGQSADIAVDAFKVKFKGYVESLGGATGAKTSLLPPENATGNYVKVVQRLPVRIRLKPGEDPEHRLRPGMSVEPTVWLFSNQ
jgi:membrane fusion protein (multidrug efflux system)